MKLLFLGTGGYHPNDRRHTLCLMIPELGLMLDAGTAMYRAAEFLQGPELTILLSHAHLDHIVGLTYLIDVNYVHPLKRITVHAEAETLIAIREHLFSERIFPQAGLYESCPLESGNAIALPRGGKATHFPMQHPGGSTGYRLDWPGHSMAYVTDTTADVDADYVEQIRGVDLLVHECYFSDKFAEYAKSTGHSHTRAVAKVARQADVGRLVLVHINPLATDDDPIGLTSAQSLFPETILGEDMMEVEF